MAKKKATELTAEELAAKRSASAKKAAATRAANKAKREAEAAAAQAVATAKPAAKAKPKTKAKKAKVKSVEVAEVAPEKIDHDEFTSIEEDYDEPFETDPNAPGGDLDQEAKDLVKAAIGKPKAKKKDKKEKKNKKARQRELEMLDDLQAEQDAKVANKAKEKASKGKAAKVESTEHLQIDKRKEAAKDRPSFKELGLIEPLQQAVADMGFEYPTVIQAQAIPELLAADTDLVGLAQTGTGKTAAFGLPALHKLHVHTRVPQVLVLAPTRELCLQITVEMGSFAKHMPGVDIAPVYGGADIVRQIKQIRRGVQMVVATPGRLRDLIKRRAVDLQHVRYLVLDEADEMLNMGFKEEIDEILESIPDSANTWLFSATMPADVRRIASEYMHKPVEVQSGERNSANADISHRFVITKPRERFPVLRRFLDYDPDMYGLVFVRTRADAKEFAEKLSSEGYNVDAIHGDLSQAQRDNVMGRFRSKRLQVLVATDVAARGIDVTGITHVFHLNLPDDLSFYTHRAGRTGRAGAEGISLALLHPKDTRKIRSIERMIKARFEEVEIPKGEQIIERRLLSNMTRLRNIEVSEALESYMPAIEASLEGLTREDIIRRLASRSFEKLLNDYRFAPDLNDKRGRDVARSERIDRRDDDRGDRKSFDDSNMVRLFINVGGMDVGGRKGNLLGMLCDAGGIKGTDIGRITMNKTHTFFDVDKSVADQVVARIGELHFDGRPVRINPAEGPEYADANTSGRVDYERGDRGRGGRSSGGGRGRDRDRRGGRDDRGRGRRDDRGGRGGGRW